MDLQRNSLHWRGAVFARHSLALVNRELALALLAVPAFASRFELTLEEWDEPQIDPASGARFQALAERLCPPLEAPAVTIRHHWPPDFSRPAAGKLVLIQPWEFGAVPASWVRPLKEEVDELWVPSSYVKECYEASGVPAARIVVVPNGIQPERFSPDAAPLVLPELPARGCGSPAPFRFLFVGGSIARKGIDILLRAFARAFEPGQELELVIKDFGTQSFYAGQGAVEEIRRLQAAGINIRYLDQDLTEQQIAGLYRACDCLVHPYRGEGYGLPIAEAMACGLPAIITGHGAALDFADEEVAYLVPASVERLRTRRIGDLETVDAPFWAKPDESALVDLLRHVAGNREEAAARGSLAAERMRQRHTWARAAGVALTRLEHLVPARQVSLPMGLANLRIGSPSAAAQETRYEARKQQGLAATRGGSFEEALEALESCRREQPGDVDVLNALAVVRFQSGDEAGALDIIWSALADHPDSRDLQHNLAFVLLHSSRAEDAAPHALAALRRTPKNEDVRLNVEKVADSLKHLARSRLAKAGRSGRAAARRDPEYRRLMGIWRELSEALERCRNGAPRLSLCMIARNEERFLRACLNSAKGVVDEIVLVDTGSTDRTVEIARQEGAVVFHHEWNDDFSEARNVSLQHATGDWALWMDADEEIAPECAAEFRRAIHSAPDDVGAYMVKIRNWLTMPRRQPGSEMAIHHACRLFRLLPGVRFEGRIHEQNLRSLQALGYTYRRMPGLTLDHFGYSGEVMALRNKHERFIRMLQREVEECPDESMSQFHLFNLGNAYFTFGDMESAALYLEQASYGADPAEEFTVSLFTEWATALHRLGRPEEGLAVCGGADSLGIAHAAVEFARGYCLLHLEQYGAAETAFRKALAPSAATEFADSGDAGITSFKSLYGLALALYAQDRYGEALDHCEQAVNGRPTMVEARYLLALCMRQLGRPAEAVQELARVLADDPGHADAPGQLLEIASEAGDAGVDALERLAAMRPADVALQAAFAQACEAAGSMGRAREACEALSRLAPESAEARVNLGRSCEASGDLEAALTCFARAIELAPDYANGYFNAGDLLYKLGHFSQAAEAYMAGLERDPDRAAGYFVLGNCYFRTGALEAAEASYRHALALQPDYTEAASNLEMALGLMSERVAA